MHNGIHPFDLADASTQERETGMAGHRPGPAPSERAGPRRPLRGLIGRRLIAFGQRLAYGDSSSISH